MKKIYYKSKNFEYLRKLGFEKSFWYGCYHFSEKDFDLKKCPNTDKIEIRWDWHLPFKSKDCDGAREFQTIEIFETKCSYASAGEICLNPQCSKVDVVVVKLFEMIKLGLVDIREK